ncbi:MAG: ABC transporter ATP-binding protein [Lachnospiraceae bacterium]|nr:ABC transporter ATP-binding protein [Lachnospiraceae bacterium]
MREKTQKHNPFRVIRNVWYMMKYSFKYTPAYLFVTLIVGIMQGAYHLVKVLFSKYLFDAIETGAEYREILSQLVLVALFGMVSWIIEQWKVQMYVPKATLSLHEGVQNELYQKARELDQSCYDDPEFYNDFIWAIRESDKRVMMIMDNIGSFASRTLSCFGVLGVLVTMDWVVALILVVQVCLRYWLMNKMNRTYYQGEEEQNPINRRMSYIEREFYLADRAKELRQGEIAKHLQTVYKQAVTDKIACIRKYNRKMLKLWILDDLSYNVLASGGITGYLIIRYLLDASFSLGSFSASMTAYQNFNWMIHHVTSHLTYFNEHSLYIEKVRMFLEYEPKIKGEERNVPTFESLTVKNLDFAYPFAKEGEKVLGGINLEINRGEKIAFVGYNGAGKTTLTKLLMRLYDSTEGEILYNGRDIRSFDPESYREHIGTVFQDFKVFAATVAENVMGGEYREEDEEKVLSALKSASFEEKLRTLPQGIHSQLTTEFCKDGVNLSGGESQKIAIARVFAKNFELVIMDEPSSALDPIAEYELNQSILNNAKDKTVIFISHRLSTTRMADRIYMFNQGRIIEAGSHDELMALDGKYAEMYRIQAKKYRSQESA